MNTDDVDKFMYGGVSLKTLLDTTGFFEFKVGKDSNEDEGKKERDECHEKHKNGDEWESYSADAAFLGPTLWDKASLEYMDLDEFLNENNLNQKVSKLDEAGIPVSSKGNHSPATSIAEYTSSTKRGLFSLDLSIDSSVITTSKPLVDFSCSVATPSKSLSNLLFSPEDPLTPSSYESRPNSPLQAIHDNGYVLPTQVNEALTVEVTENTVIQNTSANKNVVSVEFNVSPSDLALASIPGQNFDPRTRCFTEDELKPQPMIKKSRKQLVPCDLKDDKYWSRRRKNNYAAKRSRDARRLKENQIALRASFLERENDTMTAELKKARMLVEVLKKRLSVYETI